MWLNNKLEEKELKIIKLESMMEMLLDEIRSDQEKDNESKNRIDKLSMDIDKLLNSSFLRLSSALLHPLSLPGKMKRLIIRKVKKNK